MISEDKPEEENFECKALYGEVHVYVCLTKIESTLKELSDVEKSRTPPRSESPLPSLQLKYFSGNPVEWPTFWEMFEVAIHSDNKIEDVVIFKYLKSYLTGPAADAVARLKVMISTYKEMKVC